MTEPEKEGAFSAGEPAFRAVPPQPAFTPSAWPSNAPQAPGVVTAGQAVASLPNPSPASFSFGEPESAPAPVESETTASAGPPAAAAPRVTEPSPAEAPSAASSSPPATASLAITSTAPDPQQLELELAAAHEELKALHEMLEDLPEIFERKFQQRLATVMEHQKHLLADNQALRERLYSLSPGEMDGPGSGRSQPLLLPTVAPKQSWVGALKRALRLGGPQKINRHDDGQPITA